MDWSKRPRTKPIGQFVHSPLLLHVVVSLSAVPSHHLGRVPVSVLCDE